jgi:predicted dehydrogenase
MTKKINWGIIGLGKIAHKFAADLQLSENAQLYGVASRNHEKAKEFGAQYQAVSYYDSYEALANDAAIDVIYVATPNSYHFENTMMCLQKGKAVLCEKPMGLNASEVKRMIEEATTRRLFLMEAIWTRFIPATVKVVELLAEKSIGELIAVRADFGFKAAFNPESRLYNKNLGGGSLLDIGIYPIYLSVLTLGIPIEIKAMGRITTTGVDNYCAMLFDYKNCAKANLESTFEATTPTVAYIYGSQGVIKMHQPFHHAENITLTQNGEEKVLNLKYKGNGYVHEIDEVTNCLLHHETECAKLPLATSLNLITLLDKVKEQIGL